MLNAPIPENDSERLENLRSYQLLDTPFETVFNEIASLAGKICGVPYVLISLVDKKRQWFKATYGWSGPQEFSRDVSFCGHAILQDDVMEVPDATLDERFHDNPFVTGELGIRLYAGVPLVSEEGHKLGTLCVLSDKPAKLDKWQKESLQQLSRVIGALFKARREENELQLMRQVLDQLPETVLMADAGNLRAIYANAAALRRAGVPAYRDGKLTLDQLLRKAGIPSPEKVIKQLQDGLTARADVEVERPGESLGEEGTAVEVRLQRLVFPGVNAIVAVGHDITERKNGDRQRGHLQEELRQRNLQLSKAYERLTEEMVLARDTQRQFLPLPQCIGKACFDWLFIASSYLSGDIFDYFALDERFVCFHVTDVSGHGVASALLGFNIQRQIYASSPDMLFQIHSVDGDVCAAAKSVVGDLNRKFYSSNPTGMYLTMAFGLLDMQTGRAAVVQAGHPHPLFVEAPGNPVQILGNGGIPIGILADVEYEAVPIEMQPGARLVLYSDGVSEAVDSAGREFGMEGLADVVERTRDVPLLQAKQVLEKALADWQQGVPDHPDDITLVVLEFNNRK